MRTSRRQFLEAGTIAGLMVGAALVLACASVQAPPGGPVDRTPPHLLTMQPDSGAIALSDCRQLSLFFSEKMEPQPAERFLFLYPEIPFSDTKWHGRREVRVALAEALPPDTVIVVEVSAGLMDAHRVASTMSYRFPLATADHLPEAEVNGQLIHRDQPLLNGVVEMYPVPPDTLQYFQQEILRRTETDSLGTFRFRWLPQPGGPWLLRAFADLNGDLRPQESEAQRLLPDQIMLTADKPLHTVGSVIIYDPDTPGSLTGTVASDPAWPGTILGYALSIAEEDSGWVSEPQSRFVSDNQTVHADEPVTITEVSPGWTRLIFFVDADGDSLLSALPAAEDIADITVSFLEPHAMLDSLWVEPGLESTFPTSDFPATLTPWSPAVADTVSAEFRGQTQ